MNGLTTELAAAQRQVSPAWRLHGRIYEASSIGGPAPTDWEFFDSQPANLNLSYPGDYWQIAACGYGDYYIAQAYLNWRSGRLDFRIFDSDNNSDYTHNVHTITTFAAAGSGSTPLPAICHNTSNNDLYLFYQLPTGGVYVIKSSSISLSSSSWGAPTLLATATVGATSFLAAAYNPTSDVIALLIYDGTNLRIISKTTAAGSWTTSSAHSTIVSWSVAGLTPEPGSSSFNCYLCDTNGNFESITACCIAAMAGSSLTSWGSIYYLNVISGDGAADWRQQRIGPAFESYAFACAETGNQNSYVAAAGFVTADLLQEPQLVDSDNYAARAIWFHPCNTTNLITLLISNDYAYRSYSQPSEVADNIDEFDQSSVIKYSYDVEQGGAGQITIVLSSLGINVVAGNWLRLTRSCYGKDGILGGEVSLLFRITHVRQVSNSPERWMIKGVDSLGIFGSLSPRRSKIFRPSDMSLVDAIRQTFAWLGVYANTIDGPDNHYERSAWKPMEVGLSFLHRLRLMQNFFVVSRDEGNTPTVLVDVLQASSQATYSSTYTESTHHVHAYATESNLLSKVTSVGHVLFDKDSPGDGEEIYMVASDNNALTPFQNRLTRYYVSRYISAAEAELIATASAAYLATRRIVATIETNANIALEPYDRVTFNSQDYYVFSISERWIGNTLRQRVRLAAI